jgi:hypothetical protein
MGGAVKQAGRWTDKNILQDKNLQYLSPALMAYNYLRPKGEQLPDLGAPPPGVDLSDQVIKLARERERRRQMGGGTSSSFLSGVLGDTSTVSPVVKKLQGR